ncbi:Microtubules assembly and stabilization protein, partial [Elasticomyces elasticus]
MQPEIAAPSAPGSSIQSKPAPSSSRSAPASTQASPALSAALKTGPRRPNLLSRTSNEKLGAEGTKGRRNSWITSLSSKFGGSQGQLQPSLSTATGPQKPQQNGAVTATSPQTGKEKNSPTTRVQATNGKREEVEVLEPYIPQKPKEQRDSFFSSLTRRLSSGTQVGGTGKAVENGGMCPRRVMNVDKHRERCLLPELDQNKLRRVSFCVDVEIAGGPRYKDDDDNDPAEKKRKAKANKLKEKGEGEALKHPEAIKEEKEIDGVLKATGEEVSADGILDPARPDTEEDKKDGSRKKEKKKRSEEERKERKDKRRRKAEENGSIPVELVREDSSGSNSLAPTPTPSGVNTPKDKQDRPTTDPVRIYRRCCQLRETPILKRITEQLSSPTCVTMHEPGVVTCLDLAGSRLQLADFVTLGDWLAVVPVKRLLLEDADLTDEGVRVVLAGLLATKRPRCNKRHGQASMDGAKRREQAGIVEKLTLKNNPKITRVGWKHISLFLNLCRSIKALDVSMIQFPDTVPPCTPSTITTPKPTPSSNQPCDAAEVLNKALAERFGGSRLEELIMSECNLRASQIRKIVDGCIMSGVTRLGLAGNHLDQEGLEHVLHYIRSGVCRALDIGSNDLRGKLDQIAAALDHKTDGLVWGLSLADCNLDTASLKPLFPALVNLKDFRFIDLSHNRDLFVDEWQRGSRGCTVGLLRRYIPLLRGLKRIHLTDVGMRAKQAIALAEVLPEGPALAHVDILENPDLKALASAKDEDGQEEACALYASLMAAVRVSKSIICINIDVPSQENSEVVKALAKQVVAYCLRNMDRWTMQQSGSVLSSSHSVANAAGAAPRSVFDPATLAASALADLHGGQKGVAVPDVLLHLVGHLEGFHDGDDDNDPAPDDDYIVGGTGVVRALQYVLGEKTSEIRRGSASLSGTVTPTAQNEQGGGKGKAKEMSKNLLGSARKIRARLQPALAREATAGDELAYRRLLFLDETLKGMIHRFEDEYPECRLSPPSPNQLASLSSSLSSVHSTNMSMLPNGLETSTGTLLTEASNALDSDVEGGEDNELRSRVHRSNSDVSLAGRALALEEGRVHRLGQKVRRDILSYSQDPKLSPPSTSARDIANRVLGA